jgi:hypothetical protein
MMFAPSGVIHAVGETNNAGRVATTIVRASSFATNVRLQGEFAESGFPRATATPIIPNRSGKRKKESMMIRSVTVATVFGLVASCAAEEAPRNPYQPIGGGDSDTTCTPECGPRQCGPDPVCGLSCGVCDLGADCDPSGICIHPDGPILVNVVVSGTTLTPYDGVDITVIASDPDGVEDVLGGVLLDDATGATYGSFVVTGTPGTYSYALTWSGVHAVRTIDAPPAGAPRTFRMEFFDGANHRIAQTSVVTLSCDATGISACAGVCTDLMIDPANCGSCGNPVPTNPPGLTCVDGNSSCPGGGTACASGCVNTDTSLEHCGDCNVPVPTGGTCEDGVPICAGGGTACGSACIDTSSSIEHCGDCNVPVPTGGTCEDGVPTCADGGIACGGACVDTSSSVVHCGDCNVPAPTGGTCEGGVPTCPFPTINCTGTCADTTSDLANCGDCDVPVPVGGICFDGTPECPGGQENCSGVCQTSCTVDCSADCAEAVYSECSCNVADPCGWSGDGYCDISVRTGDCGSFLPTFDDANDCGTPPPCGTECGDGAYTACTCGATDPCGWSGDGYCDIGQQNGDCGSYPPTFDDGNDCL